MGVLSGFSKVEFVENYGLNIRYCKNSWDKLHKQILNYVDLCDMLRHHRQKSQFQGVKQSRTLIETNAMYSNHRL